MRKIRELLRLTFDLGLSIRQTAASLVVARATVKERPTGLDIQVSKVSTTFPIELAVHDPALHA